MNTVSCPGCGAQVNIAPQFPGQVINCPYCNAPLNAPANGFPQQPVQGMGQMPYGQPQQPYAQPQQPYGGMPYAAPIKNYMVEAVLTTLFCCMPFGIVAIIFASQVSGHQACGRIMEAQKAANNAKNWALASMISSLVIGLLYFFLACIGALADM